MKKYILILVLIFFQTIGCATRQTFKKVKVPQDEMRALLADKPDILKPGYKRMAEEGKRNFVLNELEIGLDAYQTGYHDLATRAFDRAIKGIEAVYANNETAKKARGYWYEEGMKDFKGEPYERCMAYYYRGLIFLENGDYENARACFKSGIMQDAFAEEEQNRCDFAILVFLSGIASLHADDHDLAKQAFDIVKALRADYEMPYDGNVLFLIETGKSPRKVADGPGHSELKFRRGKSFFEQQVQLAINNTEFVRAFPMEDVYFQSSSRGGRPVDKFLQGQAVFRKTHEKIGTTLSDVSGNAMIAASLFDNASSEIAIAGGALGLFAVAELAIAQRSRPHADTRYWNNLPDTIHVYQANLAKGEYSATFKFMDADGRELPDLTKQTSFCVADKDLEVVWVRSRRQLSYEGVKQLGD